MCRIGEETGMLDKMCAKSAKHLEHVEQIVSGTKRALVYPAFILTVVVGACAFWFYVVVPKILALFVDMKVAIPWPTRLLMEISNWFQNYFGWTILALWPRCS
jgi:type II secretory pathway component PulF